MLGMNKATAISFGTFFAIVAILTMTMQSFVLGATRYTPAAKPVPFWAGVGSLVVLAVFFFYRALKRRNRSAPFS
jgi:uncharacterized membrane protein